MASDYIYIFCIPGSGSAETCPAPGRFSAAAPPENQRGRGAAAFPRTSAHIRSTVSSNNNSNDNNNAGSRPAVVLSRPINRPQSAVMDVPEDRAPLPARQRAGGTSYRASFPGTNQQQAHSITDSRWRPNAGARTTGTEPVFEDRFQHEPCTVPSQPSNRSMESSHRDVVPSPCTAFHWSPRATSSPVREDRHRSLCNTRAKACWRRVFNRECCLRCFVTITTFRWLLLFFASVGAGCILSGVVLGVLYVSMGTSFLILSVMFIGLGILLIVVICIGWRCTPAGHEPCHLLFNIEQLFDVSRSQRDGQTTRRQCDRSLDQSQWFGGMIYPEFCSRTPPPTYIASMMEYADHRRRPRSVSREAVEIVPEVSLSRDAVQMVPNVSRSVAVEPVPATPPPAYPRGRDTVGGVPPVYCPRALRSRPHSFVATDSATSSSASAAVARAADLSSNDLAVVMGKCVQGGVGQGVLAATRSYKPNDEPSMSVSRSDNAHHVASSSLVDS